VRWQLDGGASDNASLRFSWRERDGPQVESPERQGFGYLVLTKAVPATLQGKVELEFSPTGIHWTLTAPLPNVLAGPGPSANK
jgi:two-component sensor histidine kinase